MTYISPEIVHCSNHCWHIVDDPNCRHHPRKQIKSCCKCSAIRSDVEYIPPKYSHRPRDPWINPINSPWTKRGVIWYATPKIKLY